MSMWNKAVVAALLAAVAVGQTDPRSSLKVNLPADSPVVLLGTDWGESRATERGSALVLNLNASLSLKNSSNRRIRAVTWLVLAQEATPGGRASVTKASLDVGPGESFPVRVDLRLMRPLGAAMATAVEVSLDGVLFDDLSFYGPNRLDSRRALLAFELEAQRDRRFFQQVLQAQGTGGLQKACLASLARQAEMPRVDVQLARGGRATAGEPGKEVELAFLRFPDAPVEPLAGIAHVSGGESTSPRVDVINKSKRDVRYLEIGWIVRDRRGREFVAAAVPARASLGPGEKASVLEQSSLRFAEVAGPPLAIEGMTGFVTQVEFTDGSVWIPRRDSLESPLLQQALAPSAEEQRLTNVYRKRGLTALVEELKKFR